MLVLCSNGLSSENLLQAIDANSYKTAALVVTADHVYKESNYHVARCKKELESLGLSVEPFDIDTQPAQLLHNYDVVEFIGGNPFYLLNSIKEHHAVGVLKELATHKVLIGWSAAAFVFGPSLELVNEYSPEMNILGLTDLKGLSLTDLEVLPHYSAFLNRFERFEERCREYEEAHGRQVVRLNDGDGVIISGNDFYLCRG